MKCVYDKESTAFHLNFKLLQVNDDIYEEKGREKERMNIFFYVTSLAHACVQREKD